MGSTKVCVSKVAEVAQMFVWVLRTGYGVLKDVM